MTGTNEQARRILYTIVETGCGPQELLRLTAEKICLDHPISSSGAANKFLLHNGLRTKKTTVYSLRYEYADRLRQNAVPEHIQRHITGHAEDTHGRYGAFPDDPDFDDKLQEMACWMGKVALPFDVNVV